MGFSTVGDNQVITPLSLSLRLSPLPLPAALHLHLESVGPVPRLSVSLCLPLRSHSVSPAFAPALIHVMCDMYHWLRLLQAGMLTFPRASSSLPAELSAVELC